MILKFCGADRTVTGSQHLLKINNKLVLLDCGLYQGKREDAYQVNKTFLFDPSEIKTVILSHAHIDHSGNLPSLYRQGFRGDIYCTPATRDLCAIMLQDSAHIQEKDTEFVNRKRSKQNLPLYKPLYSIEDAKNVMLLFKTTAYKNKTYLDGFENELALTFFDAGHILGSAQVLLEINENKKKTIFAFSGDIGRPNLPILNDPDFIGDVDYLISESTYGGRIHTKSLDMELQLEQVLNKAVEKGGKIIVPAFSVGRTQELIYALTKIFDRNSVKKFPVYVDSPLSVNATEVFKMHPECFDPETSKLISEGIDIFGSADVKFIKDVEESKKLNNIKTCCMIISASGMCESGRILHHLANNVQDPKNTILIIGFMAEHTLGRRLVEAKDEKGKKIKIFGDEYKVNATVEVLNSFSAHADKDELNDYFVKFNREKLKNIYLVHGEIDQQEILKNSLKSLGFKDIQIPFKGDEVEL
jgi:metallo-beta-lactamase family protein